MSLIYFILTLLAGGMAIGWASELLIASGYGRGRVFLFAWAMLLLMLGFLFSLSASAQPSSVVVRPETSPFSLRPDGLYQSPYNLEGAPLHAPHNESELVPLRGDYLSPHVRHRAMPGQQPAAPSRVPDLWSSGD